MTISSTEWRHFSRVLGRKWGLYSLNNWTSDGPNWSVSSETSVTIADRGAFMSHAARFELEQYEASEARFHFVALGKKWVCKFCQETPSRDELDSFLENGHICVNCEAKYERFMRN